MSVAKWIGRRAADVVAFFRDKPFAPCQVEWEPSSVRYWNGGHEVGDECCGDCKTGCWA